MPQLYNKRFGLSRQSVHIELTQKGSLIASYPYILFLLEVQKA